MANVITMWKVLKLLADNIDTVKTLIDLTKRKRPVR